MVSITKHCIHNCFPAKVMQCGSSYTDKNGPLGSLLTTINPVKMILGSAHYCELFILCSVDSDLWKKFQNFAE